MAMIKFNDLKIGSSNQKINHWIVDNFLEPSLAAEISKSFPVYESEHLKPYSNSLEEKKLEDNWKYFSSEIYRLIVEMQSVNCVNFLQKITNHKDLVSDGGLNGSGLFLQKNGGKLNPHLDYKIHPKLGYERILSVLLYLSEDWISEYGGKLVLYGGTSNSPDYSNPKIVEPKFNRLVIFECTDCSWHAVEAITAPDSFVRKALGLFYLKDTGLIEGNRRARYAPELDQIHNEEIKRLIEIREEDGCRPINNS